MLARRLARRGISVSGGALAILLGQDLALASVPISLLSSTIKQSLGPESKTDIGDIAFSPDGRIAAIAVSKWPDKMYSRFVQKGPDSPVFARKEEIRIVDAETWALKRTLELERFSNPQSLAFSPDGKTLAFGGTSGRVVGGAYVKFWDLEQQKFRAEPKLEPPSMTSRGNGGVLHLTFSPDGKILAAGDHYGSVRLFDAATGEVKQVWNPAHVGGVRGIAFSRDGHLLVSGGQDKTVKLWNVHTRTLWWTPEGNNGVVAAVALSPDGTLMATGGYIKEDDKYLPEVILWDTPSWKPKQTFTDQTGFVRTLAFSPDGKVLAVGSGKGGDPKKDGGKATGEIRLIRLE